MKKKIRSFILRWKILRTKSKIINVWRNKTKNIGDLTCAPCNYFSELNKDALNVDIMSFNKFIPLKNKVIIIGGGGLFQAYFTKAMENILKLSKNNTLVIWGAGLDNYIGNKSDFPDMPDNVKIAVRDYKQDKYPYVPCASCLSEVFDKYINNDIKHKYKLYLHDDYSQPILNDLKDIPCLSNHTANNFEHVIKFLSDAEYILSNSFHGIYWSILLNKKTIVLPWIDKQGNIGFSEKFNTIKYQTTYCKDWKNFKTYEKEAKAYSQALYECRKLNKDFFYNIKEFL